MISWLREKLTSNQGSIITGLCGLCAATGFAYIIFKSYGFSLAKSVSSSSFQRTSKNSSENYQP